MEQADKHLRTNWKALSMTREQEILRRYETGMPRNTIMRVYGIPEGQLYHIIRKSTRPG